MLKAKPHVYSFGVKTMSLGNILQMPMAGKPQKRIGGIIASHCSLERFNAGRGYDSVLKIVEVIANHALSLYTLPVCMLYSHWVASFLIFSA